jgi:hypothetical protein
MLVLEADDVLHDVAQRMAAHDRDAVVGFLPEHGAVFVARRAQGVEWKLVVGELQLLQAQHVHRVGGGPVQHVLQPCGERVDVPGGDLQGGFLRPLRRAPDRHCARVRSWPGFAP